MKRALLVIDVQNEYFTGKMPVTFPEDSFGNILLAIDGANNSQIPVILIQHTAPQPDSATFRRNSYEWELHKDVAAKEYVQIVEKSLPGSFTNTGLEELLKQLGVDTVAICGYMTQMCCDTTARQALHLGYAVEFLSDATGTLAISNDAGSVTAEELHRAILVTQAMRFSKVLTMEQWLKNIEDITLIK